MWNQLVFDYILRHSSAHLLHTCAHLWQWSISVYRSHSLAHASQISAQKSHICFTYSLSLDMNCEAVQQILAQSLLIWTQDAMAFTSFSWRSQVAQYSHASAQLLQASIQVWYFRFWSVPCVDMITNSKSILFKPRNSFCNQKKENKLKIPGP